MRSSTSRRSRTSSARLVPVEQGGRISDVEIDCPEDFSEQMLEHADRHAFLPTGNSPLAP